MKKITYRISGSGYAIASACPASLNFDFSGKLMQGRQDASDGTDEHARIAADLEIVRHFLPEKEEVNGHEHIEERIDLSFAGISLSGGIDYFAFLRGGRWMSLNVTDWKTGPAGVGHLGPYQPKFYTFLILKKYAALARKVRQVELALVSPRLNQRKTFLFTPEEILSELEQDLTRISRAAPVEKLNTGEHCRWCKNRFVCPALKKELIRFTEPKFRGSLLELTADDFRMLSTAAAVIPDIRKYAVELLDHGKKIPGLRLEWQNAARTFAEGADPDEIARCAGIPAEKLYEKKLRSPAELERAGFDLSGAARFISTTQRKVLKVDKEKTTMIQRDNPAVTDSVPPPAKKKTAKKKAVKKAVKKAKKKGK